MPAIAKLMPKLTGWDTVMELIKDIRGVIIENIDEHKNSYSEDENPRDFIDAYIKEIKHATDPQSTFFKEAGGQ